MMPLHISAQAPPLRQEDGALRVGRSHVTLESVLWAFKQDATPRKIVDRFPSLDLADVSDVVGYCLRHRQQVDAYLDEQERVYQQKTEEIRPFPLG